MFLNYIKGRPHRLAKIKWLSPKGTSGSLIKVRKQSLTRLHDPGTGKFSQLLLGPQGPSALLAWGLTPFTSDLPWGLASAVPFSDPFRECTLLRLTDSGSVFSLVHEEVGKGHASGHLGQPVARASKSVGDRDWPVDDTSVFTSVLITGSIILQTYCV